MIRSVELTWLARIARLRERLRDTPVTWYPISVPLGVAFLALYTLYKQATGQPPEGYTRNDEVLLEGPWQVRASPQ